MPPSTKGKKLVKCCAAKKAPVYTQVSSPVRYKPKKLLTRFASNPIVNSSCLQSSLLPERVIVYKKAKWPMRLKKSVQTESESEDKSTQFPDPDVDTKGATHTSTFYEKNIKTSGSNESITKTVTYIKDSDQVSKVETVVAKIVSEGGKMHVVHSDTTVDNRTSDGKRYRKSEAVTKSMKDGKITRKRYQTELTLGNSKRRSSTASHASHLFETRDSRLMNRKKMSKAHAAGTPTADVERFIVEKNQRSDGGASVVEPGSGNMTDGEDPPRNGRASASKRSSPSAPEVSPKPARLPVYTDPDEEVAPRNGRPSGSKRSKGPESSPKPARLPLYDEASARPSAVSQALKESKPSPIGQSYATSNEDEPNEISEPKNIITEETSAGNLSEKPVIEDLDDTQSARGTPIIRLEQNSSPLERSTSGGTDGVSVKKTEEEPVRGTGRVHVRKESRDKNVDKDGNVISDWKTVESESEDEDDGENAPGNSQSRKFKQFGRSVQSKRSNQSGRSNVKSGAEEDDEDEDCKDASDNCNGSSCCNENGNNACCRGCASPCGFCCPFHCAMHRMCGCSNCMKYGPRPFCNHCCSRNR